MNQEERTALIQEKTDLLARINQIESQDRALLDRIRDLQSQRTDLTQEYTAAWDRVGQIRFLIEAP